MSWAFPLRTIHLLEGFLPVPARVRSAYPPRAADEGERAILRGLCFESDEALWLWLDRQQDRLYGPDLVEKLAWLEAGALLRIQWTPNVIVLRLAGHDDEVQREENRLVDPQALKALRGGLGESCRQSLQAILSAYTDDLTFPQLVQAPRQRQDHDVARSSVRTILSSGGFPSATPAGSPPPQRASRPPIPRRPHDEAFLDVTQGIKKAVEELARRVPIGVTTSPVHHYSLLTRVPSFTGEVFFLGILMCCLILGSSLIFVLVRPDFSLKPGNKNW